MIYLAIKIFIGLVLMHFGSSFITNQIQALSSSLKKTTLIATTALIAFVMGFPEISVSFSAYISGHQQSAISSIIGSSLVNILLLFGIYTSQSTSVKERFQQVNMLRALCVMSGASLLSLYFTSKLVGFAGSLLGITTLIVPKIVQGEKWDVKHLPRPILNISTVILAFKTIAGSVAIILGAYLFTGGAIVVSSQLKIAPKITGLFILALGSALPELCLVIYTLIRKNVNDGAVIILASTFFNLLFLNLLLGSFQSISIGAKLHHSSFMLFFSCITVLLLYTRKKYVSNVFGYLLILIYLIYFTGEILSHDY